MHSWQFAGSGYLYEYGQGIGASVGIVNGDGIASSDEIGNRSGGCAITPEVRVRRVTDSYLYGSAACALARDFGGDACGEVHADWAGDDSYIIEVKPEITGTPGCFEANGDAFSGIVFKGYFSIAQVGGGGMVQ